MSDKQHYIPVCYLKGFSVNYPDNICSDRNTLETFVFTHKNEKLKHKGVINLCRMNKFYNIIDENGVEDNSIDEFFKETENDYSKYSLQLYKKHYEQKDFASDPFENLDVKAYFTRFVFNLFKRVPKFYAKITEMAKEFSDNFDESKAKDFFNRIMISMGESDTDEYRNIGHYLLNKHWTLFVISDANKRFITTDSPVTFLGHDGIANDKNEIIIPINEKILLHMNNKRIFRPIESISGKHHFNHEFLREINIKLAYGSFSHIVCSNESLLKSIVQDYLLLVKYKIGLHKYRIV